MLKMTIDDEEVVSKNNFTIKEEMLSPSSTILNNTYPKEWENDKDYTSRFYYPKDYAKLDIQNFSITPEEAGTTIDIVGSTTLTDVDTTKESRVLSLKGQTSQTGTPTPTSPIPVNVVSGDNYIDICGKNLFDKSSTPIVDYRTTITELDTGVRATITNAGSNRYSAIKLNGDLLLGKTLYMSATITPSASNNGNVRLFYLSDDTLGSRLPNTLTETGSVSNTIPSEFPEGVNGLAIVFSSNNNGTSVVGDYVDYTNVMISIGNATTYEPYIGNTYPIYLGVENLYKESEATLGTISQSDGTTISSSTSVYYTPGYIGILPNTKYAFKYDGTSNITIRVFYYDNSKTYLGTAVVSGSSSNETTFTTNASAYFIRLQFGSGFYNQDLQFTKGEKVQYISDTPIELCKIGTYQDKIYKENGSWYLHKEIGKVVLDGSEDWASESAYSSSYTRYAVSNYFSEIITDNNGINDHFTQRISQAHGDYQYLYIQPNSKTLHIQIYSSIVSDLESFKTWLQSNNTIVYYVLATSTNTEITDETLLSQLEALESQ